MLRNRSDTALITRVNKSYFHSSISSKHINLVIIPRKLYAKLCLGLDLKGIFQLKQLRHFIMFVNMKNTNWAFISNCIKLHIIKIVTSNLIYYKVLNLNLSLKANDRTILIPFLNIVNVRYTLKGSMIRLQNKQVLPLKARVFIFCQ
jgi:hypothetical protein